VREGELVDIIDGWHAFEINSIAIPHHLATPGSRKVYNGSISCHAMPTTSLPSKIAESVTSTPTNLSRKRAYYHS
jgi:hypothetical protein